jgi:hypothetical protein
MIGCVHQMQRGTGIRVNVQQLFSGSAKEKNIMTKSEEMKKFEAAVASDKELNEKFYKTVDRIAGEKTAQSDGEIFAKAAQELGYNITAADFERLDAENEEVSADELEQVAGGSDESCWFNYGCEYILRSEEDSDFDPSSVDGSGTILPPADHPQMCQKDYMCYYDHHHASTREPKGLCQKDYMCYYNHYHFNG